jgi:hypothetical protein
MFKHNMDEMALPDTKLTGIYRGVVEDNNDPLQAGRVRIRVFGVHSPNTKETSTDGIAPENLPWAQPANSLIEGAISKYGFFGVPLQGAHLFVFFEAGNIMQPRYFASAPAIVESTSTATDGFKDPDGVYPDKTGADWDTSLGTYPHNVVLHVHGGHIIEIDSTPGAERIRIYHTTGTYMLIDAIGDIEILGVNDRRKTIQGNETINITGDRTETVGGEYTLNITGDRHEDFDANHTVTVAGDYTVNVTGNVNITGATINLN